MEILRNHWKKAWTAKSRHPAGNDAAGYPDGAQAFLRGNPCKTNRKTAFPKVAVCAAPWAAVIPASPNTVYRNAL